jgi:hypothetical protein
LAVDTEIVEAFSSFVITSLAIVIAMGFVIVIIVAFKWGIIVGIEFKIEPSIISFRIIAIAIVANANAVEM